MTKKINYMVDEGKNVVVKVDGVEKINTTTTARMKIVANEVRVVSAGQTIIFELDGQEVFNYTVPPERALIIQNWSADEDGAIEGE